jgi:hypothetical protein
MEREDDPQLWDFLRHSKVPEPSPFFARNIVRAVRADGPSTSRIASWFELRRLIPSFSALAAVVIAVLTLHTFRSNRPPRGSGEPIASVTVTDADMATDLDVLSGDDDSDDPPLL